ncbi:hypothetical protein NEDG_01154 [Nematocida displodere]|uniref:Uncharacterized protein n=1 Tax=Nematocida displodere TaxID=1805483 RepID=A0A177EAR5_9MICR|nr:hypothetical protein NEDG_01154 [Nematocida displodere]
MDKSEFLPSIILHILLDKLLATNAFFLIWIFIGYARWRFYLTFSDVEIASWVVGTHGADTGVGVGRKGI